MIKITFPDGTVAEVESMDEARKLVAQADYVKPEDLPDDQKIDAITFWASSIVRASLSMKKKSNKEE